MFGSTTRIWRWPTLATTLWLASACSRSEPAQAVAPPLLLAGTAYDAASQLPLAEPAPEVHPGLDNVFRLSANIISGGEPHDAEALQSIAGMGVKTILSVDGKAPDAAAATSLGMRYVHVPIQYRGMTDEELLQIAKTFRELEGPFYVHCFHGVHRGPAAAAVGRLILDGAPREQGLAEMRQWCGTSSKYEGLYAEIAAADIPDAEQTAAYAWDFPSVHPLQGLRQVMVDVSRAYDRIEAMADNGWKAPDDHPDVDPVNEAAILVGLIERSRGLEDVASQPDDFRQWIDAAGAGSLALRDTLARLRSSGSSEWTAGEQALADLKASCTACHRVYRN